MSEYKIDIEGIPVGWEPVTIWQELMPDGKTIKIIVNLQKTKPRRIVFEETGDINPLLEKQILYAGTTEIQVNHESKIWRIKEE